MLLLKKKKDLEIHIPVFSQKAQTLSRKIYKRREKNKNKFSHFKHMK